MSSFWNLTASVASFLIISRRRSLFVKNYFIAAVNSCNNGVGDWSLLMPVDCVDSNFPSFLNNSDIATVSFLSINALWRFELIEFPTISSRCSTFSLRVSSSVANSVAQYISISVFAFTTWRVTLS